MKIYVDLIILLNFFLDFILLLSVSLILKRNVPIKRLLLASLIGSISVIALFIDISPLTLFLLKFIMAVLMVITSFSYKDIKYTINNLFYLYLVSIVLGGFLYYLNSELSYKKTGLIFFHTISINWIIVIVCTPIVVFLYVTRLKKLKEEYSKKYLVTITFLNEKKLDITGFLDTGNNLYDPYKKRPIIMINKDLLRGYNPNIILVPCTTVNKESLIKCFRIKKLVINGKEVKKDVLVGISDNKFGIEGVDLLLHKKIIKEE